MEEKGYKTFEYLFKKVKSVEQAKTVKMYEAFGWKIHDIKPLNFDRVEVEFNRKIDIKNKEELIELEKKCEEIIQSIEEQEKSKTMGVTVFTYIFGVVSLLVFGGGMSLTLLNPDHRVYMTLGVVLGLFGIALCCLTYPLYKKLLNKKISSLDSTLARQKEVNLLLEKAKKISEE